VPEAGTGVEAEVSAACRALAQRLGLGVGQSVSIGGSAWRIAGIYRTIETPLAPAVWAKPASVRLDGERIQIEPLTV